MRVEEFSDITSAADLMLLSAADRFSILIPSFLRIGHFAVGCIFSRAELWQTMHFSDKSNRLFCQHERWQLNKICSMAL
jgi:hypothetical protein